MTTAIDITQETRLGSAARQSFAHVSPTLGSRGGKDINKIDVGGTLSSASIDTTAPAFSAFTPANGATGISPSFPMGFTVTDSQSGIADITIYSREASATSYEVVYAAGAFKPGYSTSSTRSVISGGFTFAIVRDNGWVGTFELAAVALDRVGNENTFDNSYTSTQGTAGPVFLAIEPANGATIDAEQELDTHVVAPSGVRSVIVTISDDSMPATVAWDGTAFQPPYDEDSLTNVVGPGSGDPGVGIRLDFKRNLADWSGTVTLTAIATDYNGFQSVHTLTYNAPPDTGGGTGGGTTEPAITISFEPLSANILATDTISADVTNATGATAIKVAIDGVEEAAYSSTTGFAAGYSGSVTDVSATEKVYNLQRTAGYNGSVVMLVEATSTGGQDVKASHAWLVLPVPPVISNFLPGSVSIVATDALEVDVEGAAEIVITLGVQGVEENVYSTAGGYQSGYAGTVDTIDAGTTKHFSFTRTAGLVGSVTMAVDATAPDSTLACAAHSWLVPSADTGGGTPITPVTPAPQTVRYTSSRVTAPGADFGEDVHTFPTLDPTFAYFSGIPVVVEALARRLITNRGSIPFAPDFGLNLRNYLSLDMLQRDLDNIKAAVELECLKDERVESVTATTQFNQSTEMLSVSIVGIAGAGPFSLTLNVTALTVELLNPEGA